MRGDEVMAQLSPANKAATLARPGRSWGTNSECDEQISIADTVTCWCRAWGCHTTVYGDPAAMQCTLLVTLDE